MSDFPSQNQDKFVLRLPDGMRDRIKAAAEASGRSMNAEIVSVLGRAYPAVPKKIQHSLNMISGLSLSLAETDDPKEIQSFQEGIDRHYRVLRMWTEKLQAEGKPKDPD